jgi:glucose/arabinose dehydrogenase
MRGHHRAMHTPRAARRLAGLVVAAVGLLMLTTTSVSSATTVVLNSVVAGLQNPVYVTSAPDGSGRLFVLEQAGRIRVVKNGALLPTPFLDISDMTAKGGEQGLLGLAFHPSFRTNGLFYIYWTLANGDDAVNQYKVSSTNPDVAARTSSKRVITFAHPYDNHNGGMLTFDKAGYLFIGTGDGGGGGDPGNRAQSPNTLLGKILRINVNGVTGGKQYTIPAGNPYVGKTGLDEIWSYGLRNPWRFSFDRLTGDLWIGDVGQASYEEIDRSTVAGSNRGRGVNFGWRVMEGRHCYNPPTGCNTTGKLLPVVEYGHGEGCSVTGGYVYRGTRVPSLYGRYVFADFCSGTIWSVPKGGASPMTKSLVMHTSMNISSFGEDATGELYVVDRNGGIYRFGTS